MIHLWLRNLRRTAAACLFSWLLVAAAPVSAQDVPPEADLSVTKSAPATAAAGTDITYSLTISDLGPDASNGATITDPLPAGLTFVSITQDSGPAFTCSTPGPGSGGTVECSLATFPAGASATFTLVAHIPSGATPGTFITNTATASTPFPTGTPDSTDENNSASAATLVTGGTSADLALTKSAPAIVAPGANITYTLTASNGGPGAAANAQVTDPLPGDLTFVSSSTPAGWSCNALTPGSGGTLTCTTASFAAGAQAVFALTGHVPMSEADGTIYHNAASISSDTADPASENNDAVSDTTVAAGPDLTLTKTHSGNAQQGQNGFQYTITVSNVGNTASSGDVTVGDTLPSGMTIAAISGPGWVCTLGATSTCTRSDALSSGASYPAITLTVNVASNAPASVTNTATVSNGGDTNSTNDTANDQTTVTGAPDLTIAKSHSGTPQQGQNGFQYTITVSNVGGGASSGTVTVSDTLPSGMTVVSINGPGWVCSPGATSTCTRSDALAGGASYPAITLTVNIASNAPASVTNTATVSGGGDTNGTNNSASDPTSITGGPDLTITKTHSGNAQQGQNGFQYTITVSNIGGGASSGAVTVSDTLPSGMTVATITGPGWVCTPGATSTCTRSDPLNGGASYPAITLTVNVATNASASLTNTATVSGGGDTNGTNNSASDVTVVSAAPDLTISKTHSGTAQQGQNGFQFTITVSNVGNSATAGAVTVSDTLPSGMTAATITGTGWVCTPGATSTCTRSDALANGASYPAITLTVNIAANAPAAITNTATVSGGAETNTANDTASDTVTVGTGSDLTIAKTHSGNAQRGQNGFQYTITVSNVGSGASGGTVTVSDTLPAGMTATAISGAGWTCTAAATSTCTRSDALAGGSSYPAITLTVSVASNAAASVTNTATVSGGGDTNGTNNSASDPTTVTPASAADLTITKTHAGNPRQGQIGFTYTLTVSNVGTSPTTGAVTVTDTLPAGLTATAISGAGWTCTVGPTSTCTRADALATGAAYPAITLTVNVAPTASGTITNTATVSGGGDTNGANNTASDQAIVQARPDPTKDPDVVGLINAQLAEAERLANSQLNNFNDRLEHLHDDATSGDQQGIQIVLPYSDPCRGGACCPPTCIPGVTQSTAGSPMDAFALAPGSRAPAASKAAAKPTGPRRDFAFWSAGYVSFGNVDANPQSSSINFTTSGVSAGMDYRFAPHAFAGIGVGYGRDETKIGTKGTNSNAQAYSVAIYGSIKPFSAFFLDGVVGFGALKFDSQRYVVLDDAFVFGNRTGNQVFSSLTVGYEFREGRLLLAPYARINAAWLTLNSFTETGGLGGALNYSSQSANFVTSVLGLRGKYLFLTDSGAIAPRFRVEYNHDFHGTSDIALRYADSLSGPSFNLSTAPQQRDRMTFGLGSDFIFSQQLKLGAEYQHDIDTLGAQWHRFKLRLDGRY
jgi:uncharacterized repeat protein (TIGR01451 family)